MASEIALAGYGKVESKVKAGGDFQLVTETDLKVGRLIINQIKSTYPEHNIIDEEVGVLDNKSTFTWTIDPLDGTSNYASKIPMFGIMLGLLENDKPIAGGVLLPVFNEMYYAEKGLGAFCNGEQIKVSENEDLSRNFMAYLISSHSEQQQILDELETLKKLVPRVMSLRTSNCSAFDGTMVASGRYGIALNTSSHIWDCVPLHILVEEAGGIFTGYLGEEIDYSNLDDKSKAYLSFCTGAREIHRQVQKLIK